METVIAVSESQFLSKGHILTNITDFLAGGNQLLPFFQKAVNCYQWKQFLLQLGHIYSANHLFWLVLTRFFFPRNIIESLRVFLCWLKLLLKLDGGQFLKANHIPASGHHFFLIF